MKMGEQYFDEPELENRVARKGKSYALRQTSLWREAPS